MSERFITLKCESCAAPLQVYDDMARFACAFCGTEMVVERRGGTVILKAITDAIRKVQVGTDKTAAELAMARLKGDLDATTKVYDDKSRKTHRGMGCFGLLTFCGLMLTLNNALQVGLPVLIVGVALFAIVYSEFEKNEKTLGAQIKQLKQQIKENMKIVTG